MTGVESLEDGCAEGEEVPAQYHDRADVVVSTVQFSPMNLRPHDQISSCLLPTLAGLSIYSPFYGDSLIGLTF